MRGLIIGIPIAIVMGVGLVLIAAQCTKEPELNLETIDPNDPVLETLVEVTPEAEPEIVWTFTDSDEAIPVVCSISGHGQYARGQQYMSLSCDHYYRVTMDPNNPGLASCWLMDQCSKECE
jgi:hypothetical protein